MYLIKFILPVLLLLSVTGMALAEADVVKPEISYAELAYIMKQNKEYCAVEAGVLAEGKRDIVSGCLGNCKPFSPMQNGVAAGYSPHLGIASEDEQKAMFQKAYDMCQESYHVVKKSVEAFKLEHPSISETLNLKNMKYKSRVDAGYNNCIRLSSQPRGHSKAECRCTAEVIVNTINERGSYTRVSAAFVRLVSSCRGK